MEAGGRGGKKTKKARRLVAAPFLLKEQQVLPTWTDEMQIQLDLFTLKTFIQLEVFTLRA